LRPRLEASQSLALRLRVVFAGLPATCCSLSCAAALSSSLAFISGNGVLEFVLVGATSPVPVAASSRSILAHPSSRSFAELLVLDFFSNRSVPRCLYSLVVESAYVSYPGDHGKFSANHRIASFRHKLQLTPPPRRIGRTGDEPSLSI
jgi:hypothetical protein